MTLSPNQKEVLDAHGDMMSLGFIAKQRGHQVTVQQYADAFGFALKTAGVKLRRLEEAGSCIRVEDPGDRKFMAYRVTKAGRQLLDQSSTP